MERRQSLGFFVLFFQLSTQQTMSLFRTGSRTARGVCLFCWLKVSVRGVPPQRGKRQKVPARMETPPCDCSCLKSLSDVNDCITAAQGFLSENRKSALMVCERVMTDYSVEGCCRWRTLDTLGDGMRMIGSLRLLEAILLARCCIAASLPSLSNTVRDRPQLCTPEPIQLKEFKLQSRTNLQETRKKGSKCQELRTTTQNTKRFVCSSESMSGSDNT